MPETATFGFEYETPQTKPGITLTGDQDGSSPILAEQVDTALAGIDARVSANEGDITALQAVTPSDTGWQTLGISLGSGFDLVSSEYRRWGPIISIRVELTWTGADITAGTVGNVTGAPLLCTISTAAFRPDRQLYSSLRATVAGGTARIETDGQVRVTDLHATAPIRTDDTVEVSSTYFTSTFS